MATAIFGGPIVAAVESSRDERRLKPYGLHDPAEEMTEQLLQDLAKRFSLTILEPDDLDEGRQPHLVLRLQTRRWGIQKGKLDGVGMVYEGTLTLVDTRSNRVLVTGECVAQPVDGDSVEALARRGKAGLQEELAGVTSYCLDDYRHRLLGL